MTSWGKRVHVVDTERTVVAGHLLEGNSLEFMTNEQRLAAAGSEFGRDMIVRVTIETAETGPVLPCGSCSRPLP